MYNVLCTVWEKIRETKDKDRWQANNEVCCVVCFVMKQLDTGRCTLCVRVIRDPITPGHSYYYGLGIL